MEKVQNSQGNAVMVAEREVKKAPVQSPTKLESIYATLAVLEIDNIDTDMIIPKQFLKTLKRSGLGANLFYEMRYDENGNKIPDFVLNTDEFSSSGILLAGENFGCGSSREHAPWAIKDFGIRVIIANSFADIFYGNCFKNGILPIVLPQNETDIIKSYISQKGNIKFNVDLPSQTISSKDGDLTIRFEIDDQKKKILIEGLDDINQTLKHSNAIDAFEENDKKQRPWIYG